MRKIELNWRQRTLGVFVVSLVVFFGMGVQRSALADTVITLQGDPLANQEPACVALQLGTLLLTQEKEKVTLFPTLDGVGIANTAV